MKIRNIFKNFCLVILICFLFIGCGDKESNQSKNNVLVDNIESTENEASESLEEEILEPEILLLDETTTITPESRVYKGEKIEVSFSSLDILEEAELHIQETIEPSLEKLEMSCLVYDITLDSDLEFLGQIEIRMPYDQAYIEENNHQNCIEAAYFNEDSKAWQAVNYQVDTQTSEVIIFTTHLSKYGVFTFKNEKKRNASAFYDDYKRQSPMLGQSDMYGKVITEYIESEGTETNEAFNYGVSLLNDTLGIGGNSITFLSETTGLPAIFEPIGKGIEKMGILAALYQVAVDYQSGNNVAMVGNASKNLTYYTVGKIGSSVAKVASVGVFAIDYSLNSFAAEALAGRYRVYSKAYDLYYADKSRALRSRRSSMERDFYKKFYAAYQENMDDLGTSEDLNKRIDKIITDYVYEFWQDETDIAEYYQLANKTAIAGGGGLNDEIMKKISESAKADLINTSLDPVFRTLSKNIALQVHQEYVAEMKALEALLNEKISLHIFEKNNLSRDKSAEYANAKYQLYPIDALIDVKEWQGELDANGEGTMVFTTLAHLLNGAPDELHLFLPNQDMNREAATGVFDIPLDSTKIELNIGLNAPSLDQIAADWNDLETNSLTIIDIIIPWEALKAAAEEPLADPSGDDSSCDLSEMDVDFDEIEAGINELKGVDFQLEFLIEKINETTGVLYMTDFPHDTDGQCEQIQLIPYYFIYDNGQLKFDLDLTNQGILTAFSENLDSDEMQLVDLKSDVYAVFLTDNNIEKIIGIEGEMEMVFLAENGPDQYYFTYIVHLSGELKLE